jgi:hypothetical protein
LLTFVRCPAPVAEQDVAAAQLEILEQVNRGELSAAQASEILAQMSQDAT